MVNQIDMFFNMTNKYPICGKMNLTDKDKSNIFFHNRCKKCESKNRKMPFKTFNEWMEARILKHRRKGLSINIKTIMHWKREYHRYLKDIN